VLACLIMEGPAWLGSHRQPPLIWAWSECTSLDSSNKPPCYWTLCKPRTVRYRMTRLTFFWSPSAMQATDSSLPNDAFDVFLESKRYIYWINCLDSGKHSFQMGSTFDVCLESKREVQLLD
jgi:hypothetical protein